MNVLIVTNNAHLRSTSSSLNAVIARLRPRGMRPVMLFREPGPWQQRLADEGVACYFDSLEYPDKRKPVRTMRRLTRLVRLIRRERIDLVHCNEHDHFPLLRVAARWAGVPVLVHVRFKVRREFAHWAFCPPYVPARMQFTSRALLDFCRPELPAAVPEDSLRLVMNGLNIDAFLSAGDDGAELRTAWDVGPNTKVIGTASSIRPHKKLEDFVRLIGMLRAQDCDVLGVIAGGGKFADADYVENLNHQIRDEGLEQYVKLLGNLDPITPFMRAIDLFVSTSEWETFGMSIAEAMVCGTPAITLEAGGVAEVVHDPWCVAPGRDLDALAERATRLLTDDGFYRQMSADAEAHVREHFDASVIAERQARIYDEILGTDFAESTDSVPAAELEPAVQ